MLCDIRYILQGLSHSNNLEWTDTEEAILILDSNEVFQRPRVKTTVGSKHSNSSTLPLTRPPILLVEDDPNARSVLCFSLRSKGYPVEEAAEGSSALRKAEKNRPALVLTDIQMPGMNGIELVHSIRSHKELRDIPILVMTAFDPSLLAEALANGANDTIQKPIQLTSLFEKIAALLVNAAR